jgi:DNA polymerase-3 subunit gamma/tau
VYVIDEVHMLTSEAFNALLKTLEEPPAHVIFILATTEPQKLPETILSRCQRFDFRRGSVSVLRQNLAAICEREGIAITGEALEYVARRGAGSFRDSVSLLDQLSAYGTEEITVELVEDVLGSVPGALIAGLAESLLSGDAAAGLRAINAAIDGGAEPRQFLAEILDYLRAVLLLYVGGADRLDYLGDERRAEMEVLAAGHPGAAGLLVRALRLFNEAGQGLRNAARPQVPLELAYLEAILPNLAEGGPAAAQAAAGAPASAPRAAEATPAARATESPLPGDVAAEARPPRGEGHAPAEAVSPAPAESRAADGPQIPAGGPQAVPAAAPKAAAERRLTLEWVQGNWNIILMRVKALDPKIRALLNSAYPVAVRDDRVVIGCEAAFHRDTLADDRRRVVLEQLLSEVCGVACVAEFVIKADVREALRGDVPSARPPADLFVGPASPGVSGPATPAASPGPAQGAGAGEDEIRTQLLNHPVIREMQRRGGQIADVDVFGSENAGGDDGK